MRYSHHHSSTSISAARSYAHRDKRQFQPSIIGFFTREERPDFDVWDERGPGPITRATAGAHQQYNHHAWGRNNAAPALPATVQADLLSVGMRVRKSVPEGYKTHKTSSLPTIQTTLSKTPNTICSANDAYSVKPPRDAIPEVLQHQRELLPFCGLHKIGGYAEQPVTNVHLYAGTDVSGSRPVNPFPLPAEAFSQPFSSQQSSSTTRSSLPSLSSSSSSPNPANPNKRSWQDDPPHLSSQFLFALPTSLSEDDVPVSPLSETPNAKSLNTLRPFAQPRPRRAKEPTMDLDVENTDDGEDARLAGANDFGEAEFLRPWAEPEVQMGGV
ncbi:hypothetical protein CC78DRAFT_583340 [Lojkania enalia]|uniref:Uncharacterized protein n=1 Tax=Lojkania enalia TaxID=147567 RepID=A0A9P4N0Y1_9PLEO|nr:hypothetical protein CC78DRAFT_583340 [Didymosphaeria enalia]